ncbi:ExbD/TolR family protein [Yeosuana marina]|uniref:ExbD/TolR family protein n=1 Tax=Yeosuana marina TaxID=1565536 RepID=UPI00142307AC|nr:biopolymer transporter ExbD [Yeosuana marina]|tara:strand:+ start:1215 stop:1802 length:588 start_codon:yes stop_codon:yes gene_type:complete
MAKRAAPEVNAGSMADIAFLLLIFFLVTTTIETDTGINRKLPPVDDNQEDVIIKQKNIFTVNINRNDDLLVEDERMKLKDLRAAAVKFLDNGGDGTCNYCNGKKDPSSSDNPDKAIISLKNDRETSYKMFVAVTNELVAAYNDLRNARAKSLYGKSFIEMQADYDNVNWVGNKTKLKEKLEKIKEEYPIKLSEVQ